MAQAAFVREKLIATARALPAAPQVLTELGGLLQDLNVELEQIALLLKRDSALAARTIRISNSMAFGGGVRIGSVEEAVNRVGFSEVYRLVGIATTSGLIDRKLAYYGVEAEALREHMLCTAIACEAIAEQSGVDTRNAYTAGLMRCIGMLVLDRVARDRLILSQAYELTSELGYSEWEGKLFGIGNTEVAGFILEDWRFPQEIIDGIKNHHLLNDESYSSYLACVLNLAGNIVQQLGLSLPGEHRLWEVSLRKLGNVSLSGDQLAEASEQTRMRFERQRTALS